MHVALGILLVVTLFSISCATGAGRVVRVDGERMLIGSISDGQLYRHFPEFKRNKDAYAPDMGVVEEIRAALNDESIVLFLGTWCADSLEVVPKFLRVMDELGDAAPSLTMYATDEAKVEPQPLPRTYGIEFVPTFIVFRDGKELGRIVEHPEASIETNLLAIVERN